MAIIGGVTGPRIGLVGLGVLTNPLLFSQTNSVTVANTVTETPLTGTGAGSLSIPIGNMKLGSAFRLTGFGVHSAAANPTIQIKVKLNSTTILDTGAVTSFTSTNDVFEIRGYFTVRSTGTSGTIFSQGLYEEDGNNQSPFGMANTSATTIDTTIVQTLSVTLTWGTASASNTQTLTNFYLEKLGYN